MSVDVLRTQRVTPDVAEWSRLVERYSDDWSALSASEIDEWNELIARWSVEWESFHLPDAPAGAQHKEIGDWTSAFDELLGVQGQLVAERQWIRGFEDLLSIAQIDRSELVHNRIIGWLFDPMGSHRLGSAVLAGLTKFLWPEEGFPDIGSARVELEDAFERSRADIVVRTEAWTLVIEVKVDATEGIDQCERLFLDHVDAPDPYFIFLTPRGRQPKTATGEAAGAFEAVSMPTVRRLIEEAVAEHGSTPAVESYLHTMRRAFR